MPYPVNGREESDTIAAISTPVGLGGIGIIRLSGTRALSIARRLFNPTQPRESFRSHHLTLGSIIDPARGEMVDQVLLTFMKAPRTYTREDVVEINCHSGPLVLKKILGLVLEQGARLAQPGEFTLRAFLQGRIDLTRAEGIIELLRAKSDQALIQANKLLQGAMQERLEEVREALLSLMAQLEAAIDFPEEELDLMDRGRWNTQLEKKVLHPVTKMIENFEDGRPFREGLSLVIVGKPNVGKSSLLNRLLQEERAIVTPIPGTTRDTLEETILIKGLPFRLIDTAGLHQAKDGLEEAGMLRTREKVRTGHLLLFMLDMTSSLEREDEELFEEIKDKAMIILANKWDLPPLVSLEEIRDRFPGPAVLPISARYGQGVEGLKDTLYETFLHNRPLESMPEIVPTLRQKRILEDMRVSLNRALSISRQGVSPEFIAFELQSALEELGGLVGTMTTEDVLEKVFSQFCIGK